MSVLEQEGFPPVKRALRRQSGKHSGIPNNKTEDHL